MIKMMRGLLVFIAAICVVSLAAQNHVGINTTSPTGILEVHDPSFSNLLISTNGYSADTASLILRNMIGNTTGTEFIFE